MKAVWPRTVALKLAFEFGGFEHAEQKSDRFIPPIVKKVEAIARQKGFGLIRNSSGICSTLEYVLILLIKAQWDSFEFCRIYHYGLTLNFVKNFFYF